MREARTTCKTCRAINLPDMTRGEPNRVVALMIETTGLAPPNGDRVVEIGAVELVDRRLTLNRFHTYLNCGRASDPESLALHGLTTEFLVHKPAFPEIAGALGEYMRGAVLVALPLEWTLNFLDQEWAMAKMSPTDELVTSFEDPIELSDRRGHRANLNALCQRYGIRKPENMRGTLLDSWMLAKAYLALTRYK